MKQTEWQFETLRNPSDLMEKPAEFSLPVAVARRT